MSDARAQNLGAIGLVVETNPQYPDPQGAQLLIEEGINRFLETAINTDPLGQQAEQIVSEREELAERMHEAERHERSQTTSVDMS